MMQRAAILAFYNPGNIGARYAAAALDAAGVETHFIAVKQFYTDPWVRRDDLETIRRVEADPLKKVRFTFPGWYAYAPYPMPITDREKLLLAEFLRSRQFDVIGLSLYTVNFDLARDVTLWLRREVPGAAILWGGIHPTLKPEECIQYADIVCVGEGEKPLDALARQWDAWRRGDDLHIEGLWFRRGDAVIENPRPPLMTDLDSLPMPFYGKRDWLLDNDALDDRWLLDAEHLSRGTNLVVLTERGCPYACTFCVYSVLHGLYPGQPRFRRRSVENVLAEVEDRVHRLGLRHIIFHDEILGMQKEWVREFATKFKERFRPLGVTFTGYVHPLTTDEESLRLLAEAGLTRTGIGLQSGSAYTSRTLYRRHHNPEKTIQLSRWLQKYKIPDIQIDLLVDNPYEREEHLRETLDLLLQLEPPFDVACIGLVIYKECKLSELPPPDFPYDEKMHLFYKMLFFLNGIADLDRKTIRAWSEDRYLREHPERLEEIAISLWDIYRKKKKAERELEALRAAQACIQPPSVPAPPASPVRQLLRRIKRKAKHFLDGGRTGEGK
ncbi:MAG: B12-binding domain-containing radical SAM protein [Candidatus Sumerlaeia bacterium]|nr:B12-binding domain-containing radical SAM protein [Candidatus Sumerlaeia bacterium]